MATRLRFSNINSTRIKAVDTKRGEKFIYRVIMVLTFISSIVILYNVFQYVRIFGIDLLNQTNELYTFRLTGSDGIRKIPYLGALSYVALIFTAIYAVQFGYKKVFIIPLLLIILEELTSGGRASLVLAPLMFIGVFFVRDFNAKLSKIQLSLVFGGIAALFISISSNRTAGVENTYSSELLYDLTNGNVTLYKILEYITSPLGTLNAFLDKPTFSFGRNTFLTLYSFLNKLGFNIELNLYQENYYVPMRVNVGTMLREIIQDFTIAGAFIVIFLVGYFFSRSYMIFRKRISYFHGILVAVLFQIISFSFFDWRLRASIEWIILLAGTLIGLYIDRRRRKISKKEHKNIKI